MMLKPVPSSLVAGHEFIPQAIIDRPLSYFVERFNLPITKGEDDLDTFESAALEVNGLVFELKRYAGYPENSTTIYLPYHINKIEEISQLVGVIAGELNVPNQWIVWQRRDNPEL
jgi:hypothetical protein